MNNRGDSMTRLYKKYKTAFWLFWLACLDSWAVNLGTGHHWWMEIGAYLCWMNCGVSWASANWIGRCQAWKDLVDEVLGLCTRMQKEKSMNLVEVEKYLIEQQVIQ